MEEKDLTNRELESQEHQIRLNKVHDLANNQQAAWPEYLPVGHTAVQAKEDFETTKNEETVYTVAGRLTIIRDHGKTFFSNLLDRSGSLQLYIKKEIIGDSSFETFKRVIDTGDIVWAKGSLFLTRTGEVTLKVTEISLLSKCLRPLPEKFHGLSNIEQRYRHRHLDLMSNQETRDKFRNRFKIIQNIRTFLTKRDFLEVETPILHPIPGGAAARPFVTHHNAYDIDLYLRIAPELYLKRLVVGGFERVFEINRNFRNEGVSTKHNPEFTMLEFYQAHGDYKVGMETTEQLIQSAAGAALGSHEIEFNGKPLSFAAPFKKLTVEEALCEIGGLTPDEITEKNINATIKKHAVHIKGTPSHGVKLFALFEETVEAKIVQPTFIIGYPLEVSPLAKRDPKNANSAARFELFCMGMEIANGFTELNDPIDQAKRFHDQVASRVAGDDEAHFYDADFIISLEYGLPPTVGVGIGIDRLVMLLTDTHSIKDIILFPTMKPEHTLKNE